MRVLFSTGALYGFPPNLALRLAQMSGCDGVELVLDPWLIALGGARVRRMAASHGLAVPVLHPPLFALPGWHGSPASFGRIARYAVEVGSPRVVLHPPRPTPSGLRQSDFDRGLDVMRSVAGGRLTPMLENVAVFHPSDIEHYCVWPEEVARFAAARGLGITLDTTHLASTGQDLVTSYEAVHASVQHVHLSDFGRPPAFLDRPRLDTYFKHHRLPGAGDLDIAAFLSSLCRHRYDGDITLELSPVALRVWRPRLCVVLLRRAADLVRAGTTPAGPSTAPARQLAAGVSQVARA